MKKLFIGLSLAILFSACTQNQRAKSFGGTATLDLPVGKKLITATWKGDADLWYLTRDRLPSEAPQRYEFSEQSSLGVLSGTYVIIEH
jgi:hypothetical protein